MSIKLGIDKKGQEVEFDLEENNNICIVGTVHSDMIELAEKIKEQYKGNIEWINSENIENNISDNDGLVIIDNAENIKNIDTLMKIIKHPNKTIIITEKFDEETIPDNIIERINIFFVGYIRSIPNYATQRLKLKKSTMYLNKGEFIVSRDNFKERKLSIDIE